MFAHVADAHGRRHNFRQTGTLAIMVQASITSSAGFRHRLLRSERLRACLLAFAWVIVLITIITRRLLGGAVMSVDAVFYLASSLLVFAIAFQGLVVLVANRHLKSGNPVPRWQTMLAVIVDIAVPVAALTVMNVLSPRGSYASISGPSMLGIPLVTMLSILRLKPMISLYTGMGGAAAHAMLVVRTVTAEKIDPDLLPVLFSYSIFLGIIALGAWIIAYRMRENVGEAIAEAVIAERSQRAVTEMEHDLNVARDIQRELMPSWTPRIEGFEIAGMARPAQQTGGDYYDWQELSDGRLLVVLADVTGHGIGPALVMAVCRAYARASAPSANDSGALLRQVNRLIYEDLANTGRFITMVVAILSPDGKVELVSAGHGPTLLYRAATGTIASFGGDGLPLGINSAENYTPCTTFHMSAGDVLLLTTDGFMEWMRAEDNAHFGIARMESALRESAGGSPKAVIEALDAAAHAFVGGTLQQDDTTAVAIKKI